MESSNSECNLCLDSDASRLTTLIAQEGLDATIQPATIPNSIWRHRSWFTICIICFINLLRNGPPHAESNSEDDDIDLEIEMNDWGDWSDYDFWDVNFDPLDNAQEDAFWGQWREQRFIDYLTELNEMITEEAPHNIEDNDVFKAEFWENQEFWSDVHDQWEDEISNEILSILLLVCANPEKSDNEIDHPLTYHIYIGHIGHTNESCSLVESSHN